MMDKEMEGFAVRTDADFVTIEQYDAGLQEASVVRLRVEQIDLLMQLLEEAKAEHVEKSA